MRNVILVFIFIILCGFIYYSYSKISEASKNLDNISTAVKNNNIKCKRACVGKSYTSGEATFTRHLICMCWNKGSGKVMHFLLE